MGTIPNHSSDLTPAGERKRKERGIVVTKAKAEPVLDFTPDPEWHPIAAMVWESALSSGGAAFYQNSDLAALYLTCQGIDHWLSQGARKSPELLRVLFQQLGSLLFTEGDRRKLHIELQRAPDDDQGWLDTIKEQLEL
ncbi:MAG: hypothetical protein NTX33_19915 [Propionibacteriales bacterium]|nr:hypothetical protein [Propionibacteriales bacterium]